MCLNKVISLSLSLLKYSSIFVVRVKRLTLRVKRLTLRVKRLVLRVKQVVLRVNNLTLSVKQCFMTPWPTINDNTLADMICDGGQN